MLLQGVWWTNSWNSAEAMEDQGEVFDSLLSLREDNRNENDKLLGLNDLIAQALNEIQAKEAHVDATNNSG
uniref:Uncharacterized protein n=1 Tax=Tanacetum cinerariifolium TaxID=118510 RepID=A0A6L2JSU4_TANCI|nr:hypothetical protein [Tanacetum cinerariifolium]